MLARPVSMDEAMCLIAFAWQPGQACPLVVAANRDEFHDRPAQPLGWWSDAPDVAAGRDLRAGGTWLGVARNGRFAALTNYREMQQTEGDAPSRGALVADFLRGDVPTLEYGAAIDLDRYAGFSLLLFDGQTFGFVGNRESRGVQRIAPGVHALSNGALDSPWPKVEQARMLLTDTLAAGGSAAALLDMMSHREGADDDRLPETGVGLELERFLAPMFICGQRYGTRASTALRWGSDGRVEIAERRFGPDGHPQGESAIRFERQG